MKRGNEEETRKKGTRRSKMSHELETVPSSNYLLPQISTEDETHFVGSSQIPQNQTRVEA